MITDGTLGNNGHSCDRPAQKKIEIITFQVSTSDYLFLFNMRNGIASQPFKY
jgi:hypothetical protein